MAKNEIKEIEEKIKKENDYGHWKFPHYVKTFGDENKDMFGFIYKISLPNGLWYIGSKQFNSKKKLKPLKGKKRARRQIVESDWKTYTSSSNFINNYIQNNGKEKILFEIISLVKGGKFELKYCEIKHQMEQNCLFEEKCLNGIVNVRLSKKKNLPS
jgi:hypothetical protein